MCCLFLLKIGFAQKKSCKRKEMIVLLLSLSLVQRQQHLKKKSGNYLRDGTYPAKEGEKEVNKTKNRYKDILPCKLKSKANFVCLFAVGYFWEVAHKMQLHVSLLRVSSIDTQNLRFTNCEYIHAMEKKGQPPHCWNTKSFSLSVDYTRVALHPVNGEDGSDYINANFLKVKSNSQVFSRAHTAGFSWQRAARQVLSAGQSFVRKDDSDKNLRHAMWAMSNTGIFLAERG